MAEVKDWKCPICGGKEYRVFVIRYWQNGKVGISAYEARKLINECKECSVHFGDPALFHSKKEIEGGIKG